MCDFAAKNADESKRDSAYTCLFLPSKNRLGSICVALPQEAGSALLLRNDFLRNVITSTVEIMTPPIVSLV